MPRQFGKADESLSWACDRCSRQHRPNSACPPSGVWLHRRVPLSSSGVIWLKRPMPPDQWPTDGFRWWVRAHCGHHGGAIQYAFYDEAVADQVERVFRDGPCRFTRCPERIMIENDGRRP